MALHSQRKRRSDRDIREAAGERLWTEEVPLSARVELSALWEAIEAGERGSGLPGRIGEYMRFHGVRITREIHFDEILKQYPNDTILDLIGAFLGTLMLDSSSKGWVPILEERINQIFEDHRVAFRVVDGEVLPIESDELHQEIVVPALRLLVAGEFQRAQSAYVDAIKEIPSNPPHAITNAGTALQELLEALGCSGNALGPLIKSAKQKNLFAGHDQTLIEGVEKFLNWASANRNENGDSHHVSDATRADAWLMVHVVGALVVYLANTPHP